MNKDAIIAAIAFGSSKPGSVVEANVVQTTGTSATNVMSQKATTDALATKAGATETTTALAEKANIDGSYETLTAGNAEQLVSSVGINDKVPYNFRTTGGSADVGNRKTEKIVGGTLGWNQLFSNSNFPGSAYPSGSTKSYDSTTDVMSYSGTMTSSGYGYVARSFVPTMNHIYLAVGYFEITGAVTTIWLKPSAQSTAANAKPFTSNGYYACIQKATSSSTQCLYGWSAPNGTAVTAKVSKAQLFDLTLMFGPTIAEYLLSHETALLWEGVNIFRRLFPKPYYAYNEGELMSVKTSKNVMTGFNQWDKAQIEDGYINDPSGNVGGTSTSKNTGYIRIVGGSTYYIKSDATSGRWGAWYDADKNYVSGISGAGVKTAPSNACYMRFTVIYQNNDGNPDTFCVNLSWDGERDGEYESFKTYEYALDSDLELRGIWKLDANNDIYCDGDEYESDGTVTRRYFEQTYDGTETWSGSANGNGIYRFFRSLSQRASGADVANIMKSNILTPSNYAHASASTYNGTISVDSGFATIFIVPPTEITTADAFKAWLASNPITVVYEVLTPTTETADPYINPMIVDDFGTEEFVDSREVAIPVGHDTFYQANLKAKLEMAPNSPDGDGDYIVRQTSGENTYVSIGSNSTISGLVNRVPAAPDTDGTYTLKATVLNGTKTYSWVADE